MIVFTQDHNLQFYILLYLKTEPQLKAVKSIVYFIQ
jgi:hypothetical protein